jgi:peptidoglycan/xylan/chitin deacetylase (PgdA/CDA1 family)
MPYLMDQISERKDNVICHGLNMDSIHHSGLSKQRETEIIKQALEQLATTVNTDINGWLSPAKNESPETLDLLAEQGISFVCDWVNDDMPYQLKTQTRPITAMPLSTELEDFFVIQQNFHSEQSWFEQVCDACDFLINEASEQGGRLLALNIHPWLMGQPHRIIFLEKLLEYLSSSNEIWSASANQIHAHWLSQQEIS